MKEKITFAAIYKLAWPAIISHATVMFVSLIDLTFIAKLESATIAIAATAIANNLCAGIYTSLEGLRSGTAVLIARHFGAQKHDNISRTFNLALMSAIVMGFSILLLAPLISIFIFSRPSTMHLSGFGKYYLILRLLGLPFHLTIFAIIGIFRGLKNTVIPFTITIIICAFNIFLNYTFLHGTFGISATSINLIALATAIAYALGAIFSFFILYKHSLTKKYIDFKKSFRPIFRSFFKLVVEIGLYAGVLIIAFTIFLAFFTLLGQNNFIAHQIVFQILLATYLPPMGFFVASSILIGRILGKKDYESIIPAVKKIWLSSLPVVGGISLIVSIFAHKIAGFLSPGNPIVVEIAIRSIYLVCLSQIFCSMYLVLKGALTAIKDTKFVFVAGTITSFVFFLPVAYLLGITLGYGVFGGYFAFLLWTILDSIIFSVRLFVEKPWKFISQSD